ncbi:RNA polymerase sigma factor [Paenibacillus hamazuiensis]|uniref:RNA polymerase sigma factor n=1 Tax=Paenibacillus hamazuiensis TaxID=2936508 RepID=UPI00200F3728|nr:sigma-70 family RNA polymerase sigma factor [Paenibacillus hamazuiensis]
MSELFMLLFAESFSNLEQPIQAEIYRRFHRLVYGLVLFIARDHSAAEDIVQESFLKVLEKAPRQTEVHRTEQWLKAVARNTTYNYLRKWKRSRDELFPDELFWVSDAALYRSLAVLHTEQAVELKMLKEAIVRYIGQMKPEYRRPLELRWMASLSYKEMAQQLNVSENVVRQRLYRARETVRKRLRQDWGIW